jgi:hypothetical protein
MQVNTRQSSNLGSPNSYPLHTYSADSWSSSNGHEPSTWVHLLESPSPFAYEEAFLLCQKSEDEWIAWIPDFGEIVLKIGEFCTSC